MRTHTPFLGRSSELDLLDDLVMEHRLISLVGPGGIGKTRLAREFALAKQASLDGNILFATLAGATAQDDVADIVARNAGLASVDALRYGSVDRARLIVLDNCEPALAGAAELARSLIETDRTTRVLVTTRIPLGLPEERVVMVGPLAMPADDDPHHARSSPTVQLFVDRAQRAGALSELDDDTVVDIAHLVRQLDGMPLAIELAAARTRVLSPRQISLLLDDELGLLHRSSGGVDRHQSMRAVIAASYQPLAPHVQSGFRSLCVFNAPFDLDLAHQLMGTRSDLEAVEVITELIDSSLLVLTVGQGSANQYRVLEPIRRFGLERLQAEGEHDAHRRSLRRRHGGLRGLVRRADRHRVLAGPVRQCQRTARPPGPRHRPMHRPRRDRGSGEPAVPPALRNGAQPWRADCSRTKVPHDLARRGRRSTSRP